MPRCRRNLASSNQLSPYTTSLTDLLPVGTQAHQPFGIMLLSPHPFRAKVSPIIRPGKMLLYPHCSSGTSFEVEAFTPHGRTTTAAPSPWTSRSVGDPTFPECQTSRACDR